ncbi:MAG: tRNA (adenosine(37)-N6)-dimethylallyltransferase MiaA [Bacteroidota bacterium]
MSSTFNSNKTIILIAGPTAVGKTAIALALAKHFNTAIISADSRQCFREMSIGTAKPSPAELSSVYHYFINSHSIHDKVDAALFENYALAAANSILADNPVAVMVGGTGMYLRAFCEGLDAIPAIDEAIQKTVRDSYETHGLQWLQDAVAKEDPEYFATGETQNPQRLTRALEVKRSTGKSIRSFQSKEPMVRPFNIIKIGLELPRPELNERIHHRVDIMMHEGLLNEVKQLVSYRHLNALQTVGYKEIFEHLDGICSLEAAIEFVKTNTRQYAKRQMTWFKKDPAIKWFSPFDIEEIQVLLEGILSIPANENPPNK